MLAALLLVGLARLANASYGWDQVSGLKDLDALKFKEFLKPVLDITANTYRHPDIVKVPGWELAPGIEPLNPENGGAHALAYIEENGGRRLVVGFRGTDLKSTADKCADMELFKSFVPGMIPPNETVCSGYTSETLDYYSQAVNFTLKVLEAYPGVPLLLTGHSLGAALAYLVSAHFSSSSPLVIPVVSFSTPAMKRVLERKLIGLDHPEMVYAVGNEWDLVMSPLANQVGSLCLYQTEQPLGCAACKRFPHESLGCLECFFKTHYLASFLALVKKSDVKPVCVLKTPASDDGSWLL